MNQTTKHIKIKYKNKTESAIDLWFYFTVYYTTGYGKAMEWQGLPYNFDCFVLPSIHENLICFRKHIIR